MFILYVYNVFGSKNNKIYNNNLRIRKTNTYILFIKFLSHIYI